MGILVEMDRFICNESSRRELDTSKFAMTGAVMGPGWGMARVQRKLWLPFRTWGTHIHYWGRNLFAGAVCGKRLVNYNNSRGARA